ncbi:hypothetical protein SPFL3101_02880 [Sporomusaceae bacterium FL31]|nr:hypothetical protein SPFL3101_02880 [Sporomusaceae bacterium FL31]
MNPIFIPKELSRFTDIYILLSQSHLLTLGSNFQKPNFISKMTFNTARNAILSYICINLNEAIFKH